MFSDSRNNVKDFPEHYKAISNGIEAVFINQTYGHSEFPTKYDYIYTDCDPKIVINDFDFPHCRNYLTFDQKLNPILYLEAPDQIFKQQINSIKLTNKINLEPLKVHQAEYRSLFRSLEKMIQSGFSDQKALEEFRERSYFFIGYEKYKMRPINRIIKYIKRGFTVEFDPKILFEQDLFQLS